MPDNDRSGLVYPENSDIQEGAIRISTPKQPVTPPEEYTSGGNYIPASGGTRGWFQNSGVLQVEYPNNYRYQEAIDVDAFSQSSIDVLQESHERNSKRFEMPQPIKIHTDQDEKIHPGFCVDISMTGAKIRVRRKFEVDSAVLFTLCTPRTRDEEEQALFTLDAFVRWCKMASKARNTVRYYCGLQFEPMDLPSKEALANIMK